MADEEIKITTEKKRSNFFYIGLITLIWLITYIACTFLWVQKLGWDEVNYLGVAKGITQDFDFSARFYTIMGILRNGYPTHFIHFPIFSAYLAIFLKLFGVTLHVAYFANWVSALGVCILIYFIFLMLSEDSRKFAFLVSLSYLFCPGVIKNCDTAMMEQFGCFLLCFCTYFILRDYARGVFNYLTTLKFSLTFLILWLYKSLFVGIFAGALLFILFSYNSNSSSKKLNTKIPLPFFLLLCYGQFVALFYILQKYLFLPVASMMNFTREQEQSQVYADFLGGFFLNFPENLLNNINSFLHIIIEPYFIYPASFKSYTTQMFDALSYFVFVGLYFFFLFLMVILTFGSWKELSSLPKVFICLALGSIVGFNFVFNVLFSTSHGNVWRYNLYYLPFFVCYVGLILKLNLKYFKHFTTERPVVSKAVLALFLIMGYIPLFFSIINHSLVLEDMYHYVGKLNAQIIESAIKDYTPKFVYFNDGTHITWTRYPTKQVMKDATNEQLLKVNEILPEPIEFLFIKPSDWLFKNNQELILMAAPILDGKYSFYGLDRENGVVVYRFNRV